MEKYVPDMYQQSIYTIDYQKLINKGIKCILFDLDNTLAPINFKEPDEKLIELINNLKEKNFKLIIFSNSPKHRVKIFADKLKINFISSARKPCKKNVLLLLNKYEYNVNEVAIIGDQILTDILCGNKVGIMTILTKPLSNKDLIWTKINRIFERRIMKKLRNKNLFSKDIFYEL